MTVARGTEGTREPGARHGSITRCAATPCAVGARASASELARQTVARNTITGLGACKMKERSRKAAAPRWSGPRVRSQGKEVVWPRPKAERRHARPAGPRRRCRDSCPAALVRWPPLLAAPLYEATWWRIVLVGALDGVLREWLRARVSDRAMPAGGARILGVSSSGSWVSGVDSLNTSFPPGEHSPYTSITAIPSSFRHFGPSSSGHNGCSTGSRASSGDEGSRTCLPPFRLIATG